MPSNVNHIGFFMLNFKKVISLKNIPKYQSLILNTKSIEFNIMGILFDIKFQEWIESITLIIYIRFLETFTILDKHVPILKKLINF